MIVRNISMSRLGFMVLFAAFLAAGAGCAKKDRAERGGTLVVGEINDYEGLNPMSTTDAHARDVYNLLFLSLLDEQSDLLNFAPRLARVVGVLSGPSRPHVSPARGRVLERRGPGDRARRRGDLRRAEGLGDPVGEPPSQGADRLGLGRRRPHDRVPLREGVSLSGHGRERRAHHAEARARPGPPCGVREAPDRADPDERPLQASFMGQGTGPRARAKRALLREG